MTSPSRWSSDASSRNRHGQDEAPGATPGRLLESETKKHKSDKRRRGVGGDEHGQLGDPAPMGRQNVQRGERRGGPAEGDEPRGVVTDNVGTTPNLEREPAVRRSVSDRGDEQGNSIRYGGDRHGAQRRIEDDVCQRAGHADRSEGRELADLAPERGRGGASEGR